MQSSKKALIYGGAALGAGVLIYMAFFRGGKHKDDGVAASPAAPTGPDAGTSMAINQLSNQMQQMQQQEQLQQQNALLAQQSNPALAAGYGTPAYNALYPSLATSAPLSMNPPTAQPHSGYQWILGAGPTGPTWIQEPAATPAGQHWAQSGTSYYLAANQPGINYPEIRPTAPSLIVAATHA